MSETGDAHPQAQNSTSVALQDKFNHGIALHQQGRLAEAERIYREIVHQQKNHFEALYQLGVIALTTRHTERALELFQYVILLKPDFANVYNDRGIALRRLQRLDEALASYDQAILLKPEFAMAHNNRTNALLDLCRPEEALASCEKAIALDPSIVIAYYNRGLALQNLNLLEEALASYDQAIARLPDFAEAIWNKALCLLLLGRFEQGLPLYEWRKWRPDEAVATTTFPQPLWLGKENVRDKTVLIWWEQGLGDTIQFSRYAKLLEAEGAKVIFLVQQPLLSLLKQISPTIKIVNEDEIPTDFDFHCPLQSLPLAFRTTLATMPAQLPYLTAEEKLRLAWEARLPPKTKPRIGLVWSGRADAVRLQKRSIELQQLLPLTTPDADWICLQKELKGDDPAILQHLGRMAFFGDDLRDFSDTAALLDLMDLVITTDTSVAHLAGAMGKPVWILLLYNPDWRWLLDREDSPWYPTARLFRQDATRAWDNVIARVRAALGDFMQRIGS